MRRIDLLIGGVIVLAIIFSFVGVATYDAVAGDRDFTIVWASESSDTTAQGSRTGDGSTDVPLPVNFKNITKVEITARVVGTGARLNAVTVNIKVEPLNGTAETKAVTLPQGNMGNTQETTFSFAVAETPNATTASGPSENETLAILAGEHTNTKGMGSWKITFTVSGSNPSQVPVGPSVNSYTFTTPAKVTTYTATLQPLTPDLNR